jgi:hypothetical protein
MHLGAGISAAKSCLIEHLADFLLVESGFLAA